MKINKLEIENFKGIEHAEFDLSKDNVFYLSDDNGKGKTSTLQAINFVLTKKVPENCVRNGQGTAKVSCEYDGHTVTRIIEGADVHDYLDGENVKATDISQLLENGTKSKKLDAALNLVSSSKIDEMTPAELADFLIRYVPDKPNLDQLIGFMDGPSEKMKELIGEYAEKQQLDTFTLEDVRKMYRDFYSQRTPVNKMANVKIVEVPEPQSTMEEVNQKFAEIAKAEAGYQTYLSLEKAYNTAVESRKKQETDIENLKKEVSAIKIDCSPEQEIQKLENEIKTLQSNISKNNALIATFQNNMKTLVDAGNALKKNICPYSVGGDNPVTITCTTDKTNVLHEMGDLYHDNKNQAVKLAQENAGYQEEITKKEEQKKKLMKDMTLFVKKQEMEKQIAYLQTHLLQIPEKPVPVKLQDFTSEKNILMGVQKQIVAYQQMIEQQKEKEKVMELKKALDGLVKQFSEKGVVYKNIIAFYLNIFEQAANNTASLLNNGIKIKFVTNNGLCYLVKMPHAKIFVPYRNLSGGEKLIGKIVLLDMINQLSGCNIMVIDEMDILDDANFDRVVELLKTLSERYDNIFFAMTGKRKESLSCFTELKLS